MGGGASKYSPLTFNRQKPAFALAKCATHVDISVNNPRTAFTLVEGATHVDTSRNNPRTAFTLAEILITLGIIGIVVAMTMPMLIKNYKRSITENRLKKSYSMIAQAFLSAQSKHGEIKDWPEWDNAEQILTNYIVPEFTFVKNYKSEGIYGRNVCFEKKYFIGSSDTSKTQYGWINGTHIGNPFYGGVTASMRLPDGSCLALNPTGTGSNADDKLIALDLNGSSQAPNRAGYDLFFFKVDGNTIKPNCFNKSKYDIDRLCNKSNTISGHCCAAKIVNDGWKIKYW